MRANVNIPLVKADVQRPKEETIFFEKLHNKPFWILNIEEHKTTRHQQ